MGEEMQMEIAKLNGYEAICLEALDCLQVSKPHILPDVWKVAITQILQRMFASEKDYLQENPTDYFGLYNSGNENDIKITVREIPSKLRPFSKLKKQIENLFDPALKMQFCCSAFPMRGGRAHNSIPRFYVKLGKEIIWDYPKDFPVKDMDYGLWAGDNGISELVREYIDAPIKGLVERQFKNENKEYGDVSVFYGLTDLFKAADRRLGANKLLELSDIITNESAREIIGTRLVLKFRSGNIKE